MNFNDLKNDLEELEKLLADLKFSKKSTQNFNSNTPTNLRPFSQNLDDDIKNKQVSKTDWKYWRSYWFLSILVWGSIGFLGYLCYKYIPRLWKDNNTNNNIENIENFIISSNSNGNNVALIVIRDKGRTSIFNSDPYVLTLDGKIFEWESSEQEYSKNRFDTLYFYAKKGIHKFRFCNFSLSSYYEIDFNIDNPEKIKYIVHNVKRQLFDWRRHQKILTKNINYDRTLGRNPEMKMGDVYIPYVIFNNYSSNPKIKPSAVKVEDSEGVLYNMQDLNWTHSHRIELYLRKPKNKIYISSIENGKIVFRTKNINLENMFNPSQTYFSDSLLRFPISFP